MTGGAGELTFRPVVRQRLGSLLGSGICLALGIAFAVIGWVTGDLAGIGAAAFGLGCLAFLAFFLLSSRDFTRCDGNGVRCQVLGRRREWTWPEINDIEVRTSTRRGISRRVAYLVLHDGGRVTLPAPTDGGAARDPGFDGHVEQIREYWRRSGQTHGRSLCVPSHRGCWNAGGDRGRWHATGHFAIRLTLTTVMCCAVRVGPGLPCCPGRGSSG